jgi:hypothetical protein
LHDLSEKLSRVDTLLANAACCEQSGIEPYIPPHRDKHNRSLYERFSELAPLPGAKPIDRMRNRLKTLPGRKVYAKRRSTVERMFGIVKQVLDFRQFFLRGLESVSGEWALVSIAWNMKRMFALKG